MIDASTNRLHPPSSFQRRREAKQFAFSCFLRQKNALLLIAATLIPIIMIVAGQGIYSMLFYAVEDPAAPMITLMTVLNVFILAITIPLIGGTLYIATGVAHGEDRRIKDIFYAYTSVRAWLRTWIALLIPALMFAAIAGVSTMVLSLSNGMVALTQLMEQGPAMLYGNLFQSAGLLFSAIMGLIGLILFGIVMPFPWLVLSSPKEPLGFIFVRTISSMRGHLCAFACLHLSFIGWLLLSVATVGVLLVLFVIPFYLLTVTKYMDGLAKTNNSENEI